MKLRDFIGKFRKLFILRLLLGDGSEQRSVRPLGFLILFIVSITYLVAPRDRLYHADLITGAAQFEAIDSQQNQWLADDLLLCEPDLAMSLFDDEPTQAALCEDADYWPADQNFAEPILKLAPGTKVIIQWSLRNGLNMELQAGEEQRNAATLISAASGQSKVLADKVLLRRQPAGDELRQAVTLTFEGYGVFGSDARAGVSGMLGSGSISAYEDNPLWSERYLAGEAQLSLGDTVKFVDNKGNNALAKGFMRIAPNDEGVEQGIYVIAYSSVTDAQATNDSTKIQVFRFGSEGYRFSPTLWARIQNAPDVALLVSMLGLFLALAEVSSVIANVIQKARKQDVSEQGEST